MKTTGKYSNKKYKCSSCGNEEIHGTNHYGEIYITCKKCSWNSSIKVFVCLETLPEGWGKPQPWEIVKLGDVCEIIQEEPPPRE